MKNHLFLIFRSNLIQRSLFIISLLISTSGIYGQTPADFSGVWTQDNVKSDDFYKDFNITCTIKQSKQEIIFDETFFSKSGEKITSKTESYTLDGKETSVEEQGGTNKKSAKWSADMKTLTIKNTRTVGSEVYGSYRAYTLSEKGRILTIVTTDANPLTGLKVTQVFNKK